jgi:hypothetical protein
MLGLNLVPYMTCEMSTDLPPELRRALEAEDASASPHPLNYFARPRKGNPFGVLNTPQSWQLFLQSLVILFGTVAILFFIAMILWIIGGIGTILLTLGLAAYVFYRSHQQQQKEWWINQGCCAACGYDLHDIPDHRCPECGRDATQDEPEWRKVRRTFVASKPTAALPPSLPLEVIEVADPSNNGDNAEKS